MSFGQKFNSMLSIDNFALVMFPLIWPMVADSNLKGVILNICWLMTFTFKLRLEKPSLVREEMLPIGVSKYLLNSFLQLCSAASSNEFKAKSAPYLILFPAVFIIDVNIFY